MVKKIFSKAERGGALLEAALVIPVLTIFVAGIIELGIVLYNWFNLTDAVREATRVASVSPLLTPNSAAIASVLNKNLDPIGSYTGLQVINTAPATTTSIQDQNGQECGRIVTVQASYNYPFTVFRIFGARTWNISSKASMRYALQPLCT